MDSSNGVVAGQPGGGVLPGDLEVSAGFATLDKSRQVLVFQTIQEAISAVPPRREATFPRVVAAYTSLTRLVESAASGQLSDEDLARLETDVEAAGGVIAPGLWSQGDNSIAAFRAATFGMLRKNFSPAVVDAAIVALNARLQTLKLNDLGRIFQVMANFFSPLTSTTNNAPRLQTFESLEPERQVLVFKTMQEATLCSPPRSEATFGSVVAAFRAEQDLLRCAADGQLSDAQFAAFESSVEAAGGVLAPATYAQGKLSIGSFRAETFRALQTILPADVLPAAISALNARLRDLRPTNLPALFKAVRTFFNPLLSQAPNTPALQNFKTLDPARQAQVFRTVELSIASHPELESSIFSASVKAVCAEQAVIEDAASGRLSPASLQQLKSVILECGGCVAPDLRATGEGSIGDFIDSTFATLERDMPPEVCQAAIAALNAKLSSTPVSSIDDIKSIAGSFLEPLLTVVVNSPSMRQAPQPETLPPAEPAQMEEFILVPPLEQELPGDAGPVAPPVQMQSATAIHGDGRGPFETLPLQATSGEFVSDETISVDFPTIPESPAVSSRLAGATTGREPGQDGKKNQSANFL